MNKGAALQIPLVAQLAKVQWRNVLFVLPFVPILGGAAAWTSTRFAPWNTTDTITTGTGTAAESGTGTTEGSSGGNDDACPLCDKFMDGPCSKQFRRWLDCTERNKEDYVAGCKTQFDALQVCLEKHDDGS